MGSANFWEADPVQDGKEPWASDPVVKDDSAASARQPLNRWVTPSKEVGGRGYINPTTVEPPGLIDRAITGAKNLADGVVSTAKGIKDQFGVGEGGTIRTLGQVVGATPEGVAATLTNLGGKIYQGIGHVADAYGEAMAPADEATTKTLGTYVAPSAASQAQPSPGQVTDAYMRDRVAPAAARLSAAGRDRVAKVLADPKSDPVISGLYRTGQALEDVGKHQQEYYQEKVAAESPEMAAQSKAIDDAKGFVDTVKAMATNPLGTAGIIAQSTPDMLVGMGASKGAAALRLSEASGLAAKAAQVGDEVFEKTLLKYAADPKMAGQARELARQARTQAINDFVDAAAERAAGGTGLVTEAIQSGANSRAQVQDFVAAQPDDKLRANNERYRQLRRTHSEQEAKAILGEELGAQAAGPAALWTGAAGKASGAADAWGHTMAGHPVSARQAVGGAAKEGLEEALQNPGEDYAGHAAKVQADPNDQFDLGGSIAQGAFTGAAQGGALHGGGYALSQARQLRSATFDRFDDLAAAHGLPAKAVAAAKQAMEKVPLDELPAKLKKVVSVMTRNGLFGLAPSAEAINSLDHPPSPEADAKTEPVLAPEGQVAQPGLSDTGDDATGLADSPAPVATPEVAPQEPADPVKVQAAQQLDDAAHQAATSPLNDRAEPTQAQKEAGNYAKGHIRISGLDIAIENPAGSVRSGVSPEGVKWENPLQHHYGYVKGTVGNDKDHLDVFVKPGITPDWNGAAFVVDQVDPATGKLDEHKVVLGAKDESEAEAIYRSNYAKDWQGFGAITKLPMAAFKAWAKSGKLKEPLGDISGFVPAEPKPAAGPSPVAPEMIAGKPVTEMQTGQLLRIAKMQGASERARQVAAAEVKRRETEAMYAQRDREVEAQREQIQAQAKDDQVAQAIATSEASEAAAPTAMAAAFLAASQKKAKQGAGKKPATVQPIPSAQPAVVQPAKPQVKRATGHVQFDPERDSMLQALAKFGGIKREVVAAEFGLKPEELRHAVPTGRLKAYPFRKTGGMNLDQAINALQEAGYFDGVPSDELRNQFERSIFDELGGSPRHTSLGTMRKAADAYNEHHAEQAQIAQQEEESKAEAEAERQAIMAEAGLTEADLAALSDEDIDILTQDASDEVGYAASMRALGFTEEEIEDGIKQRRFAQGSDQEGDGSAGRSAPSTDDGGSPTPWPAGGVGSAGAGSQTYAEQGETSEGNASQVKDGQSVPSRTGSISESEAAYESGMSPQEKANKAKVLQGPPVAILEGHDAPMGYKPLREWAAQKFADAGGKAVNPEIGDVVLDERAVRDSLAHGMSPFKAEAFAAVPAVIEKGVVVLSATKGSQDTFYISAPVQLRGVDDVVTVLVRRNPETQRMYLHSVATKEYLLARVKSRTDAGASEHTGGAKPGDVASVLRELLTFKPDTAAATNEQSQGAQNGDFGTDYSGLAGRTVTQEFRIESTGQVAIMKMDAREAMQDLDRRETALNDLAKCLKSKGGRS